MRVFMLGWEFPPFISGGLGTACYGLTKAMSGIGTDILFVLPRPVSTPFSTHLKLVSPRPGSPLAVPTTEFRLDEFERVTFRTINAALGDPYLSAEDYERQAVGAAAQGRAEGDKPYLVQNPGELTPATGGKPPTDHYGGDLLNEVQRYAALAAEVARNETFDVVHAHDWMTFPAGMAVAALKGVPLVVHVHSTEFDRSGVHVDTRIYDIERRGMHAAMKVIAVSAWTKNLITHHYGVEPHKVEVVYNAIETNGNGAFDEEKYKIHRDEKIVLFLGRITMQKGPEYFLAAAR
jgi:glycosyltransferase involved in cell wall biosynthesis